MNYTLVLRVKIGCRPVRGFEREESKIMEIGLLWACRTARRWAVLLFRLYDVSAQHSRKQRQVRNSGRIDERESRGRSETDRQTLSFSQRNSPFFFFRSFSAFDNSFF